MIFFNSSYFTKILHVSSQNPQELRISPLRPRNRSIKSHTHPKNKKYLGLETKSQDYSDPETTSHPRPRQAYQEISWKESQLHNQSTQINQYSPLFKVYYSSCYQTKPHLSRKISVSMQRKFHFSQQLPCLFKSSTQNPSD